MSLNNATRGQILNDINVCENIVRSPGRAMWSKLSILAKETFRGILILRKILVIGS